MYVFIHCFKLNIYPGQQLLMLIRNAIKDMNFRIASLFWDVLIDIDIIYPPFKWMEAENLFFFLQEWP